MAPNAAQQSKDLKGADTSINANQLEQTRISESERNEKRGSQDRQAASNNVVNALNNSVSNTNVHQAASTAHAPQAPAGIGNMGVGSRG